jgi:hypothetical protein
MVNHSLRIGQEASKTEAEPTSEWTGGTPTHWLLLQLVIELEVVKAEKGERRQGGQTTKPDDVWTGEGVPQVGQSLGQAQQGLGGQRQGPGLCSKVAV